MWLVDLFAMSPNAHVCSLSRQDLVFVPCARWVHTYRKEQLNFRLVSQNLKINFSFPLPPPPRSSIHPNMFAIATQQRTYFAGAPSQEEMQLWIGMLESLRQHHQQQSSPVSLLQATPTDSPTAVRSAPQNRPLQLGGVEGEALWRPWLCVVSIMFGCV